jgi:hypothetical protein
MKPWRQRTPEKLFSEKHATYARFIAFVRYPQGLRAFFRRSSLLWPGIRILDAVHDALVDQGVTPGNLHAFDLTPAMLERFEKSGLIAGLIVRWRRSMALGIGAGLAAGLVLSSLAAIGQHGQYFEIVLPACLSAR